MGYPLGRGTVSSITGVRMAFIARVLTGVSTVVFAGIVSVGAAEAAGYGTLADCVRDSGAVMYEASWCPACKAQRKEFRGYVNRIKTVQCDVGGKKGKTRAECERMNIDSYPTWVFGDGSSESGFKSAKAIAARTGCEAPD